MEHGLELSIYGRGASPPSRGAPKTGTWYEHTRPAATRTARSDALARYAPGPSVTGVRRDAIRRADDPADVRPCKKRFQRLAVAHVRGWERGRAPAHGGTRGSRAHAHVTRSHTHTPHTSVSLLSPGGGPAPGFQKHPGTLRSKIFATRIHRRIQEGSTKGQWKHESEIVSYSYTPLPCPTCTRQAFYHFALTTSRCTGGAHCSGAEGRREGVEHLRERHCLECSSRRPRGPGRCSIYR